MRFFQDNGYPDGELFFDCMGKNDWVIPGEKEPGGDWRSYAKHWAFTRIKAYRKGFGG